MRTARARVNIIACITHHLLLRLLLRNKLGDLGLGIRQHPCEGFGPAPLVGEGFEVHAELCKAFVP